MRAADHAGRAAELAAAWATYGPVMGINDIDIHGRSASFDTFVHASRAAYEPARELEAAGAEYKRAARMLMMMEHAWATEADAYERAAAAWEAARAAGERLYEAEVEMARAFMVEPWGKGKPEIIGIDGGDRELGAYWEAAIALVNSPDRTRGAEAFETAAAKWKAYGDKIRVTAGYNGPPGGHDDPGMDYIFRASELYTEAARVWAEAGRDDRAAAAYDRATTLITP